MSKKKWVYLFNDVEEAEKYVGGNWVDVRGPMGCKGPNLADMTLLGVPVPPCFTVTSSAFNAFLAAGEKFPEGMWEQELEALKVIEKQANKKFGDTENPLLVSCRSGAKFSMPGMMDTILNLGLNDQSVEALAKLSNNPRFAYDSYRRLIQMFGNVVLEIPKSAFDEVFDHKKKQKKAKLDTDLDADALRELVGEYKALVRERSGADFPEDPWDQLWGAIGAVFTSWENPRAVVYRGMHGYPADWGTAVNVQAMVFGNLGLDSGTGVAFTRDPASGQQGIYGDYLQNAQGEDVVAGIRNTVPLQDLERIDAASYKQLLQIMETLENHYRDLCDIEFTIERGKLWMLQTRVGKRTAEAAFRIAPQLVDQGLIDMDEALAGKTVIHPELGDNICFKRELDTGGVDDAFAKEAV